MVCKETSGEECYNSYVTDFTPVEVKLSQCFSCKHFICMLFCRLKSAMTALKSIVISTTRNNQGPSMLKFAGMFLRGTVLALKMLKTLVIPLFMKLVNQITIMLFFFQTTILFSSL